MPLSICLAVRSSVTILRLRYARGILQEPHISMGIIGHLSGLAYQRENHAIMMLSGHAQQANNSGYCRLLDESPASSQIVRWAV